MMATTGIAAPVAALVSGAVLIGLAACASAAAQDPDARLAERLEWFQDLRFGLFLHWGVYSQWGCIESWPLVVEDKWARPDDLVPWVERDKDIERFKRDYFALNRTFNPTRFDPAKWAEAAKYAGMKYVVFTTKHHDGFSMFDTRQTDWRVTHPDCPYSKNAQPDIVRDVFDAFRKEGFGIGAYFSKSDWHSPYYWSPDAPARTRNPNYNTREQPERWAKFVAFVHGQVEELVSNYGRVDILWLDGGQVRPPDQDIQMDRLADMARKHQPDLLMVDRTVGGKYENYRTPEQEVPDKPLDYVWESCLTMGTQWSYKPNDAYKPARTLVHLLVDIVSKGGNLLLNIGPQPDGQLPPEALKRLKEIGDWMTVNAEAVHGTRPIAPYKAGSVCLTRKGRTVYAIYLAEEGRDAPPATVRVPGVRPPAGAKVAMLGVAAPLEWQAGDDGVTVAIPASVAQSPPCRHAWVIRIAPAAE
jgi:alpha-L-fucosidase